MWNTAEDKLREVLNEYGCPYEEAIGEAAFYGPKLDVEVKPAVGPEVTLSTCQLDFLLPKRFNLTYIAQDGTKKTPVVIHRAIFGTFDRFTAFLMEATKGVFPLWLSPVQVNILPVNNEFNLDYANKVKEALSNFRVKVDSREEKVGYRMRESVINKIPYTVIIGNKEQESNTISYRKHGSNETINVTIEEFISKLTNEIKNYK